MTNYIIRRLLLVPVLLFGVTMIDLRAILIEDAGLARSIAALLEHEIRSRLPAYRLAAKAGFIRGEE